jgi:RNA polymerase sigma-70 factor (ECF subfamily)
VELEPSPSVAALSREHRRYLWGLCYRMTGSAADADDLVQDTLVRAMERPPERREEPMRPWLTQVAMNLCRDHLRRRKRRGYVGPWLPSPVDLGEDEPPAWEIEGEGGTERRYDLMESVSYAFLLALEALGPQQRAVLLLRDVLDYSVRETAAALALSEANVKTTHHRARAAMAAYDTERQPRSADLEQRTRAALERFLTSLMLDDVPGMEAVLAESVHALSDGAGEFAAARVPIVGRDRVIRFLRKLVAHRGIGRSELRVLNGLPAVITEFSSSKPHEGPRVVTRVEIGADGRITEIHSVLATRKLSAVRFWDGGPTG